MQVSSTRTEYPKYNVVTIPDNAPEEVKRIMDVQLPMTGPTPMKATIDPEKLFNAQLKIAEKLQAAGYNPLEYGINIENINQKLQNLKAAKEYQNQLKLLSRDIDDIEKCRIASDKDEIKEELKLIPAAATLSALASGAAASWFGTWFDAFGGAFSEGALMGLKVSLPIVAMISVMTLGKVAIPMLELLLDKCGLRLMKNKQSKLLSEGFKPINAKPSFEKVSELLKSVPKAIIK